MCGKLHFDAPCHPTCAPPILDDIQTPFYEFQWDFNNTPVPKYKFLLRQRKWMRSYKMRQRKIKKILYLEGGGSIS
jgi:hypothetical protein